MRGVDPRSALQSARTGHDYSRTRCKRWVNRVNQLTIITLTPARNKRATLITITITSAESLPIQCLWKEHEYLAPL
jgi:hypothetical protein